MIRFLHLADVHLDTVFLNRDAQLRSMLREALRDTFKAGVDLALASGCHAMLIAGDLFDNQTLSFMTEKFLLSEMERLSQGQVQVFYATGNHDPSESRGRVSQLRWPDNVHIFTSHTPESYPLVDQDGQVLARIVGGGHENSRVGENLASRFPQVTDHQSVPQIALLHAMVTGSSDDTEHERYAPCSLQDLCEKGYSYWALGHVHKRAVLSENPYVVYPGNLMGRNAKESGSKGAYLVEIDDYGQVKLSFHTLAPLCWLNLTLNNLEEADSLEKLEQLIVNSVEKHLQDYPVEGKLFLRLKLEGRCPMYRELAASENLLTLEENIRAFLLVEYLELEYEGLTPPLCPENYKQGPHILSEVLTLLEKAEHDDDILLQLAPENLAGLPGNIEFKERVKYLRSLLQGLDYEAVARLVEVDEQ